MFGFISAVIEYIGFHKKQLLERDQKKAIPHKILNKFSELL